MNTPTLRENIELLVGSGASDFEISREFKNYIKRYFSSLDKVFETDFGREFLYRHTKEIDAIIQEMFRYIFRDSFGDYQPLTNSIPICVVALGSYGRQQLAVYSDIDIMLLFKDIKGFNTRLLIERFLYMAWDAGLKIGHRVHEIGEITEAAKADITIKTAILESRFILGSKFLWIEYQNKLREIKKTETKAFIFAKLEEMAKRHKKYRISMEPNIKEGIGGLRDSNTLFWLATSIYGVTSNKDLIGKLFSEGEYREYRIALEFIFKLRNALHLLCHKKCDELLMQNQREVALKLGFKDSKTQKAETLLMSKTLKSMQAINLFSSINCSRLVRTQTAGDIRLKELRAARGDDGLFELEGRLYAPFHKKPTTLLFAIEMLINRFREKNYTLDYSIHNYLQKCALQKKQKKITKEVILKLLSIDSYKILFALYETSLLQKLFLPFEKICFLAQFDGYHTYPVDIHTLESIKNVENIRDEFVLKVFNSLRSEAKIYLKLALLFHDIGKGRSGNHSALGARIFVSFAKKIGLAESEMELVKKLILHHTLMSHTAFREDLNSQKTILSFVGILGSKEAIDMLFVLTYADLESVGKSVYSSFNAQLLRELYLKSIQSLSQTELISEAKARVAKESALAKSEEFLALDPTIQKKILSITSNLFFIKLSVPEILDICKSSLNSGELYYKVSNEPYLSFEIISKKWINFGKLLSRFAFLDIVSMDIFKLFDGAKYFKVSFDATIEREELETIEQILKDFSRNGDIAGVKKVPVIKKTDISFDFDHSESYVKMTLTAKNQQGLLAFVIEVFDDLQIDIATAKVSTVKNVAKDMFLIERSSGIAQKQKELIKRLTQQTREGAPLEY